MYLPNGSLNFSEYFNCLNRKIVEDSYTKDTIAQFEKKLEKLLEFFQKIWDSSGTIAKMSKRLDEEFTSATRQSVFMYSDGDKDTLFIMDGKTGSCNVYLLEQIGRHTYSRNIRMNTFPSCCGMVMISGLNNAGMIKHALSIGEKAGYTKAILVFRQEQLSAVREVDSELYEIIKGSYNGNWINKRSANKLTTVIVDL